MENLNSYISDYLKETNQIANSIDLQAIASMISELKSLTAQNGKVCRILSCVNRTSGKVWPRASGAEAEVHEFLTTADQLIKEFCDV